jgi:hypothetical protein
VWLTGPQPRMATRRNAYAEQWTFPTREQCSRDRNLKFGTEVKEAESASSALAPRKSVNAHEISVSTSFPICLDILAGRVFVLLSRTRGMAAS